jgi:Ni,Fe-hydrogenase III large subunit
MYYVATNGSRNLERLRVRTPTFANVPALMEVLPGSELADVPVLILSKIPASAVLSASPHVPSPPFGGEGQEPVLTKEG